MKNVLILLSMLIACGTTISAKNNYVLKFGASADYVTISKDAISGISGSTTATFEAWVKPASSPQTARIIDHITPGGNDGFLFDILSGKPRLVYGNYIITATTSLTENIWYHIAVTSAGDSLRMYINGMHHKSVCCNGTLPSNSYDIRLGLDQSGSNHFTGSMREVRIWNYARSQSQIETAMVDTVSRSQSGLLGCWRLDESSGTTAADANGTYNGTLYNFSYTSSSGWVQLLTGAGTSSDPYQISSLENILCLASNSSYWGSYFIQTADISVAGISNFLPIGNGTTKFTGTYDGSGYKISGLTMSRTGQYTGLFGYAYGATIKNLGILDASVSGYHYTGILAGMAQSSTAISECYSTGTVTSSGSSVGGLVGELQTGCTISNCYTTATVYTNYNGANVGGMLGYNYGTVSYCYAASTVTSGGSSPALGGLIGNSTTVATASFYNSDLCSSGSTYAMPESADSMKIQDIYTARGWDFSSTWGMSSSINSGYPYLLKFEAIVTTQEVTDAGATCATGNGTIVNLGGSAPTAYGICWNTTGMPTTSDNIINLGVPPSNGSFTASITGLSAGTMYYVRAYITNGNGSNYGDVVIFATSPSTGDGSSGNPYQITSLSDLLWLSQNNSVWNCQFMQTADIDASDTKNWNSGAGFSTIGNGNSFFKGKYYGNRHIIKNLYINRSSCTHVGLFGFVSGATITNLGLADAVITGYENVAGIVGYSLGSHIAYCFSSGTISGTSCIGGIVGNKYSSAVTNCYSSASVCGSDEVGGICGENYFGNSISYCYSSGPISGDLYVGGISGYTDQNATVSCCIWDVDKTGQRSISDGPNIFYNNKNNAGLTTAQMKVQSNYTAAGWDFIGEIANGTTDMWAISTIDNDGYPCFTWQVSIPLVETLVPSSGTGASVTLNGTLNHFGTTAVTAHGFCWSSTNTEPTLSDSHIDLGAVSDTGTFSVSITGLTSNTFYVRAYAVNDAGIDYGDCISYLSSISGSGTSGDPYTIGNIDELQLLSENPDMWSKYYIQTADIDADTSQYWNSGTGFVPIGNSTVSFTGNYNGNGHTITNLCINRPSTNYVGLFGYIGSGGEVDSLAISIDTIKGQNEVGGLAGHSNGTIKSCSTSGIVVGTTDVGGLIGTTGGGTVCYSHSSTTLNGSNNVSGLIGTNSGNISYCYSTGNATASGDYTAGGLVGWNNSGTISNCYSTGTVKGPSPAGGLLGGGGGTITNCYAVNTVTCTNSTSNVGGLIGNGASATINNSYYNTDIFTGSTSYGTGVATDAMQTQSTFTDAGWDFTDVWGISTTLNDGYPYLQWTVEEDNSLAVELTGFTAVPGSGGVRLTWHTESETENLGFIIQRKTVGANHDSPSEWTQIASYTTADSLAGHGSTSEAHAYACTDAAVAANTTYAYRLGDVDYSGKCTWHKEIEVEVDEYETLPTEFGLQKAYPNPFNPSVTLRYGLTEDARTTLKIYNLRGQLVATLVNDDQVAGYYNIHWQPQNLSSGIYLVRLESGHKTNLQKVVFVK